MRAFSLYGVAFGVLLGSITFAPGGVRAAVIDLHIPSITGEDSPPGFAGSMRLDSLEIVPGGYTITKDLDSASPQIFAAVAGGTPLGTSSVLLYNAAPSGPPAALLPFASTFASAQLLGGVDEQATFVSTVPTLMYLHIPGITGDDSTPGYAGAMQISSFSLTGGGFSIVKELDSASPQILAAVVQGTPLNTATLLLYDASPAVQPYAIAVFHDVFGSATQSLGGVVPTERDSFVFATVTPEPGAAFVSIVAAGGALLRRRNTGSRTLRFAGTIR